MTDARVASVVRELLAARSKELFAFEPPAGASASLRAPRRLIDVRRRDVNVDLFEVTGRRISAKDFRTWAGTLICASALANAARPAKGAQIETQRAVAAALREAAEALGNTPAVCRKTYVFDAVLNAYDRGHTVAGALPAIESLVSPGAVKLRRLERSVLKLLSGERSQQHERAHRRE
jgi:DNA topoisomerase I